MKPTVSHRGPGRLERLEPEMRQLIEERESTGYSRELQFFTPEEVPVVRAVVERLVPHESPRIDLVSFLDWAIGRPLGDGARRPGLPDERTLVREGLTFLQGVARARRASEFSDLGKDEQKALLGELKAGKIEGGSLDGEAQRQLFRLLLRKALLGYTAHPDAWERMGFYGPAYPDGYLAFSLDEIKAQRERKGRD